VDIISSNEFIRSYNNSTVILTEGAVGLRTINEFELVHDKLIMHASHIYNSNGRAALAKVYGQYLQVAEDFSLPIILMTNTRRANMERALASQYRSKNIMSDYASFLREVIGKYNCEVYVGGYIGGKGDGYTGDGSLSTDEAERFHLWQIEEFNQADIDFIFISLMPNVNEAVGMVKALEKSVYPYLLSFMVKEDGTIPDGHTIHNAINTIDSATNKKPLCYMANCIHPQILKTALLHNDTPLVRSRFRGIQANAAYLSPEELDKPSETISSSPSDLANEILSLHNEFPLKFYGGCCGTDGSHLREFANYLLTNKAIT